MALHATPCGTVAVTAVDGRSTTTLAAPRDRPANSGPAPRSPDESTLGSVRRASALATPLSISATVSGPAMTIHFAVTTLYPAVACALGPDVMLDLIAPDMPVRVRSADEGDLSTLAMPSKPETDEEIRR